MMILKKFQSMVLMVGNAWELIATQFLTHVASKDESGVAEFATPVAITEGLLRNILKLMNCRN